MLLPEIPYFQKKNPMRKFLFALFFTGAGAFAALLMIPANAQRYEVKTIWSRDSVKPAPEPVVEAPAGPVFNDTIEVQIYRLKNDAYGNVVQLEPKKKKSEYIVPVWIGSCEMDALNFKMRNQVASRPMTYDLMTTIFSATGMKLKSIVINKLEAGTVG